MKTTKKILSIFLAVLMLLSVSSVAFAAESVKRDLPVVHVPGFYSSDIYADVNDHETLIDMPGTDEILELVKKDVVPALITFCADRNTDKLATTISSKVNGLFADWFYESNGEAQENSGVDFDLTPEKVTATSKLVFRYDWRGDLMDAADKLNIYINNAIDRTGCDKVALTAHSLGSSVIIAYISKYGNSKIDSILFDSPACEGVAVVGNLLTGKVTLDAEAIAYFLKTSLGESEYDRLLVSLVDIFDMAEIPELFTLFIDEIIEALAPAVYKETVAPLFGYWPAMWAMVSDDQIDEAMAYIFDDILKDQDTSALQAKIIAYNDAVRGANRETFLRDFDEKGNFTILCRYGSPAFPLTDASDLTGDTVIETKSSSLGATTAPIGDYFSDSEIAGVDAAYISPDRTINASTCMFPEKTWFIKNSGHFENHYTDDYYDFFLFADEEITCDMTEFGRFCTIDREAEILVKDTSEPEKAEELTPMRRLFNFLIALFKPLADLFSKIFNK